MQSKSGALYCVITAPEQRPAAHAAFRGVQDVFRLGDELETKPFSKPERSADPQVDVTESIARSIVASEEQRPIVVDQIAVQLRAVHNSDLL